ncbi:MAG: hypothetical protein RL514_2805 [Verrucomicrobiota bacterium]
MFTNLERLFQPEVIHKQTRWWVGMALLVILGAILRRWPNTQVKLVPALLCIVGFLFLLGLFLPSLAKAKGSAGISIEQAGVQILTRQTVGTFDTVTLSSPDGAALTRWLNEHGFAVPAAAAPVIADYAKQGWVFAAAKLSRPDASGKTSPHPLAFKFKTDRAVYPLRLTGVENDRCLVELYVFGESRAELPGFKVEQCLAPEFTRELAKPISPEDEPEKPAFREPSPGQLRIRHPALRSLVVGATVGTKLVGTLDAEAMSRDAFVAWVPFERKLASYYSREAAGTRALNLGVAVLLLTLPCVGFWLWRNDRWWTARLVAQVLGWAIVVGTGYFVVLPKVEVEIRRERHFFAWSRPSQFVNLKETVQQVALDSGAGPVLSSAFPRWDLKRLQAAVEAPADRHWNFIRVNALTGEPLREEATPGNLLFRPTERGTEVLWHDVDCVAHLLGTLPTRAP